MVVHHPPVSGAFIGDAGYVEVIVSEPTATFFTRILGSLWASLTPAARAVAGTSNNMACLITLRGLGSTPYSLEIGNTQMTLNGCGAAVGGDLNGFNPNSTINGTPVPSVGVVGSLHGHLWQLRLVRL